MNFLLFAIMGGFIITTVLMTFYILRKPKFVDTIIFYFVYASYYTALLIYYLGNLVLAIILGISIMLAFISFRFLKNLKLL
ncbi:hypothetical protein [Sulfuracidifex tepidarius]|uniref:Uncharacterized protein n=1 Tax=Sulfuracidifex tepidarius TaxID=1294262 RepID=A0A510E606_9CREN|nr:hypothetical protein [Sulfuracidifex tepidarius]BBG25182.1 hypothetical protein IC006_2517 [Sulfuracidifex tepidarius]BBG27975.1 hypothetical protein IC007_2530 [Sulfuracidifex tepidarius]